MNLGQQLYDNHLKMITETHPHVKINPANLTMISLDKRLIELQFDETYPICVTYMFEYTCNQGRITIY